MSLVYALAAATCFAAASVLQQNAAQAIGDDRAVRFGLLFKLVRSRRWLAGKGFDYFALGFQALALSTGTLLLVQPVIASGLLLALPVSARLHGRRLGATDHAAAATCTVGLAMIVAVANSAGGKARPGFSEWAVPGAIVLAMAAVLVAASYGRRGARRALLLGGAGGIGYGLSGALLKATVDLVKAEGFRHGLWSWEALALVLVASGGSVLVASAFQAGSLAASLPALTAMEPVVAAFLGVTAFSERLTGGAPFVAVGLFGAAIALVSTVVLARSAAAFEDAAALIEPA